MVAVSVEDCADVLVIDTEVGDRPHEGYTELETPDGPVTAQVSVTVPVKELPGVTVIIDVNWLAEMLPPLPRVKLELVVVLGACQKSPQHVRKPDPSAAANINPVQLPVFIAAPQIFSV